MQEVVSFISHHVLLSSGIVIIFALLIMVELLRAKKNMHAISPLHATQMINHNHAIVIDIRPPDLFQKGHIIDAQLIAANDFLKMPVKKREKFKTKPLIFVCQTGLEAQKIAATMRKQGYNAYVLAGGMRAWLDAQMPIIKGN